MSKPILWPVCAASGIEVNPLADFPLIPKRESATTIFTRWVYGWIHGNVNGSDYWGNRTYRQKERTRNGALSGISPLIRTGGKGEGKLIAKALVGKTRRKRRFFREHWISFLASKKKTSGMIDRITTPLQQQIPSFCLRIPRRVCSG